MKLQPSLSFNDVFHLAIKIEKQLKGRNPFVTPSPYRPQSTPKSFPSYKGDTTPTPIKALDKGKGIAIEPYKCFKCHGYGHFQADYPSQRTLSIIEVEQIQALEEDTSEEEFEEEDYAVATPNVGETLVIRRALHAKEVPLEPSQRTKSSTLNVPLEARSVSL